MSLPALLGGKPMFVRADRWPEWPLSTRRDERRLLNVLRSGVWGLGSPVIEQYARRLAATLKVRHVLPVNSGTAALELAVKALGIGPGDEVIVPAYTFVASATCVLEVGATVVFADINPRTLNLCPRSITERITRRTRAIVAVHFGGNPCDMLALRRLCDRRGIAIIEDAAHAHGMLYRGKPAGKLGRAACFSYQSSKNMTSGEGGALVTDDPELFELAHCFHSFGRKPGQPWYMHYSLSWNHRMSAFQAAALLGQLERLEAQTRRRFSNGRMLNDLLAQLPGQRPQADTDDSAGTRRAFHLYIWRFDAAEAGMDRRTFLEALNAEGIPASGGYPHALPRNPMFLERRYWHSHRLGGAGRTRREPDYRRVELPVTDAVCADAVWLPHRCLLASSRQVRRIADAVGRVLDHSVALSQRARSTGRG